MNVGWIEAGNRKECRSGTEAHSFARRPGCLGCTAAAVAVPLAWPPSRGARSPIALADTTAIADTTSINVLRRERLNVTELTGILGLAQSGEVPDGRPALADGSLSRLLRDDWPKRLELTMPPQGP